MTGNSGDLREEAARYLEKRARSGRRVLHRLSRSDRIAADRGYADESRPPKAEEVELVTSPGPVPGEDIPHDRREEGISRDTRAASPMSLFAGENVPSGPQVADMDLDALEKTVSVCRGCSLCETRTNTVFGDGNPSAGIVFVGEAPGRDEDLQGIPFVGRAGKLLDKILGSVGFSRKDVYIANMLKCRPPGNRDPLEEEVESCEPFLERQLELIDPVLICALGRVAGQSLLKTKASLKVLRQGIHHYNGVRALVTYHPAALLRNPQFKRPTWEDMKLLRRLYDEKTAERREDGRESGR